MASQIENRRQPERMRVVIIRAPVKSSSFIPGSFTFRILPHPPPFLSLSFVSLPLSRFFTTREIFPLCVAEHLGAFRGCGKEANGVYSSLCELEKDEKTTQDRATLCELLDNLLSSFLSQPRRRLITNS